ncbi:hypothetical protein GGI17_002463 [Coemansia sp. S146]|nr:hypothetical protein GGI17_002463 [Coemansia sp. S146]
MSYNNDNYGQYNDQGGSYGQPQHNSSFGGQQPYDQYGNQQSNPPYDQYGNQQSNPPYDQYGNQQSNPPYDQYGNQQSNIPYDQYGNQQSNVEYDNRYGGQQQQQNPQAFAFDVDLDKVTDKTTTEQLARMMLGKNQFANELTGLETSTNSARDLKDFDMKDLEESSRDITERGIFDGFGGNGKSKKSHQLLGGAAAWAALNWYQTKSRNQGKKVSHGFAKKLMVAFAAAQAIKYWEQNSKSFQNGVSRDLVIAEATRSASLAADISAGDELAATTGYTYNYGAKGGEADSFDGPSGSGSRGQQQYYGGHQQYGGGLDNNQYGGGYSNQY